MGIFDESFNFITFICQATYILIKQGEGVTLIYKKVGEAGDGIGLLVAVLGDIGFDGVLVVTGFGLEADTGLFDTQGFNIEFLILSAKISHRTFLPCLFKCSPCTVWCL